MKTVRFDAIRTDFLNWDLVILTVHQNYGYFAFDPMG